MASKPSRPSTSLSPDLVFLDVQMPKLDGFEVLELIDSKPAVIFVTAYDQYAMRAFDAQAADYLLKPFTAERFERALDRAKSGVGVKSVQAPPRELTRIVVRDGTKVHVIPSRSSITPRRRTTTSRCTAEVRVI